MKCFRLTALFMSLCFVVSCGDDADAPNESSRHERLIEALTRAVKFERGVPREGDIATLDPSLGAVSLLPDDSQLDLGAGVASLVGFEVDGLDDGDEPVATLLQFEGSESHTRVPVEDPSDAGAASAVRIENPFRVEDDVCEYLCDRLFTAQLGFAIELADGKVSRKRSVTVVLDCRQDGSSALCDGDDDPDAGDGDGDGDASTGSDAGDGDGDSGGPAVDGGASSQPVVSGLSPASVLAGEAITLSISGSNFGDDAQAYLDGNALPTTVVSDTLIEIDVPASNTLAGSLAVVVENSAGDPSSGSNVLYLQVTAVAGAPTIYDYSPDNGVAGDSILIIASNLAGQTLMIHDAEGTELTPGALSTISWPTAGSVDTVEITLPDDIATGPITVSNMMGSYRGKIFSVGLNLTRAVGTVIESSTEYNATNWSRVSGADNLLATSFFTAIGDCATLDSCTTTPFFRITLASDQDVARIAMRGNREYASGYDFIRGSFELLDASGDVLWGGTYDLPAPDRDLDITLADPVRARALRFTSLEDESSEPGFAELEMFAR